jgi:ABC-type lipoprotein export system ATPase subunit
MAFIEIRDVHRTYRTVDGSRIASEETVLNGLSLDVARGELMAIVGPNGCGKSTLLNMIGGLDTVEKRVTVRVNGSDEATVEGSGSITIDGFPISSAKGDERADFINRNVGFVFQSHHLIAELDVLDNVALPMMIRRVSRRKAHAAADEMLRRVELEKHAKKRPALLSGGQKQRVAIARALINRPRLLLADEPTGSLDPALKGSIFELLRKLNREDQLTVILVTHDLDLLNDAEGRSKVDRVFQLAEAKKQKLATTEV